ncbi:MAG: hypothetical protein ACXVRA_13985, partial [Gaiellaceae bacterium]
TRSLPAPTLAADQPDAELRAAPVASLKRKRKFVQDAVLFVSVNGEDVHRTRIENRLSGLFPIRPTDSTASYGR